MASVYKLHITRKSTQKVYVALCDTLQHAMDISDIVMMMDADFTTVITSDRIWLAHESARLLHRIAEYYDIEHEYSKPE